jgi:hypothetical protein
MCREYAYESSLVCWFPLRLSKEPILSHLASFGHVGIPAAPTWKLDECRTEVCGVEVVWEGPPQQGGGDGKEEVKLAAFGGGPMSKKHAPTGPNPTAISFYILHMSPLDPFDLSQEHVSFTEIYRGAHTAFRVANLEAQQSYLFRVQAVSLMGEGVWSQKICMTTLHPAQQMHDATNQMHPFQPSHRQHPGGYDQPLPPTSLLQPNSSYTNGGYASIHGQMLSSTAAFDPMQSMVAHLASPKNGTASAAATQRSMAAEGGWQSARSHGASTMASRVGSPTRFSAGTASLNAGMAAAAYGAPPVAPLSPSHTLSHVPSARATWEELWKLSVILREKDVPSLMRFFLPQVPVSGRQQQHSAFEPTKKLLCC